MAALRKETISIVETTRETIRDSRELIAHCRITAGDPDPADADPADTAPAQGSSATTATDGPRGKLTPFA